MIIQENENKNKIISCNHSNAELNQKLIEKEEEIKNNKIVQENQLEESIQKYDKKCEELINFENLHREIVNKNKNSIKEISDLQQIIIEENFKIKGIILDLISAYKNENENDLKTILIYLVENQNEYEDKGTLTTKNKEEDNTINNDANIHNEFQLENSQINEAELKEDKFTDEVIGVFDKMLKGEFKRLERYLDPPKMKTIHNSASQDKLRIPNVGKNYVEWKVKTNNSTFLDMLRSSAEKINHNEKQENVKLDLNEIANEVKQKIKSTIRNDKLYDNYSLVKKSSEENVKFNLDKSSLINSESKNRLMNSSLSPFRNENMTQKKNEIIRE